jgi:nitrite reductase (NADH) small subunit
MSERASDTSVLSERATTELGERATTDEGWETVCELRRLQPGRGVAALVGGRQVALFRAGAGAGAADAPFTGPEASQPSDVLHAIDNLDPCSGASVLSRGIVGDRKGEPVVASPMYKQAFSLVTGQCLDEPDKGVAVHRVRLVDGWVQVELR